MPRKSIDVGKGANAPMDKLSRRSERSHEENQERAYIAASRRADRSIEARVQSARMASEIHKKRTGKSFRITEEIVMKEEMYEEDDDDIPRSIRLLGSHMQTDSTELNSRVEAYLSNRVAMSAMLAKTNEEWRDNIVHRLFAQSFPNADQQAQQLSQGMPGSMYNMQPQQHPPPHSPPAPQSPVERPVFQSVSYVPRSRHRSQARSRSIASPTSHSLSGQQTPSSIPESPAPRHMQGFDSALPPNTPIGSAFTTDLPPEARMLMGMGVMDAGSNTYDHGLYTPDWSTSTPCFDFNNFTDPVKEEECHAGLAADYFTGVIDPQPFPWENAPASMEEPWDTFIDDSAAGWIKE